MQRQMSPYNALQKEVDRIASSIDDPDGIVFDRFFVEATTVLASYGDINQQRNATLCAYGLLSWSDEDRETFIGQYELTARVYQNLANIPEWPYAPQE